MMGSSLCKKIGVLFLCVACLVFVGCGGGGGDPVAIGKEMKAATTALTAAGTDADKKKAAEKLGADEKAKYDKLDAAGKKKADDAAK